MGTLNRDGTGYGETRVYRIHGGRLAIEDASRWVYVRSGSIRTEYIQQRTIRSLLPPGKRWLRIGRAIQIRALVSLAKRHPQGVIPGLITGASADPFIALDFLTHTNKDIRMVGSQRVNGRKATHYLAAVVLASVARAMPPALRAINESAIRRSGISSEWADVWLDPDGRVVKMRRNYLTKTKRSYSQFTTNFAFATSSRSVRVHPPRAGEVIDYRRIRGLRLAPQ
jgi:hypothetical protein